MLSRRDLVRMLAIGAATPLLTCGRPRLLAASQPPRLHAMIVGINEYDGRVGRRLADGSMAFSRIKKLNGCLNDSSRIEAAVRPYAASVRVLRNREASRKAFLSAWQSTLTTARAGDVVLLTYAGHGGQEAESVKGNESDGLDETLILAGFDAGQAPSSAERIVDDEMAALFAAAAEKRVTVIYVVDACHSGTPTRSVDPRAAAGLVYRSEGRYDFTSELTTAAPAAAVAPPPEELPNLIVLTGGQDDEIVPELTIDGRKHGALSYALARGLSGAADLNQDGVITGAELTQYVLHSIRAISDSGQHPQVRWPTPDARMGVPPSAPLLALAGRTMPAAAPAAASRPAPRVRLEVIGLDAAARARLFAGLVHAEPAVGTAGRDLLWHAASGDLFNELGNRIAQGLPADRLAAAIDRKQALDGVARLCIDGGLALSLRLPGEDALAVPSLASDRTHSAGTRLRLRVERITGRFLVVFNMTGSGVIQDLDKVNEGSGGRDLSVRGPAARNIVLAPTGGHIYQDDLRVEPPFGADHVVAVAGASPLNQLAPAVRRADGKAAARVVLEALLREAELNRLTVGYQGIYTASG